MADRSPATTPAHIPFGEFLVDKGYVTPGELEAALIIQQDRHSKLGRLANRRAMLTFEKICAIREHQHKYNLRFGEAALALGLLSQAELAELLQEQNASHIPVGKMLVELNILKTDILQKCLEEYQEMLDATQKNDGLPPSSS